MKKQTKKILKKALKLRTKKEYIDSNLYLKNIIESDNSAYINYQMAWSYDLLGEESKAVIFYLKALQGVELKKKDQLECFIGLGSSYRVMGKYIEAQKNFEKALLIFLSNLVLKYFYAIATSKFKKLLFIF
ncbi:hypothetical protein [Spiroplasma floricola]|uniref:Uncharacterized protein n=1 Tax=Spiroplasma floricola 23-6 TaxID=1336749 RepID=A0A2K8SDM2_9MOLU|nr:hypothetical protein [Spiroplasma floricola]AUB31328.1 hypothetical protein SFLOR_v1c02710 [Spiroplasma floricola 23-6]